MGGIDDTGLDCVRKPFPALRSFNRFKNPAIYLNTKILVVTVSEGTVCMLGVKLLPMGCRTRVGLYT